VTILLLKKWVVVMDTTCSLHSRQTPLGGCGRWSWFL